MFLSKYRLNINDVMWNFSVSYSSYLSDKCWSFGLLWEYHLARQQFYIVPFFIREQYLVVWTFFDIVIDILYLIPSVEFSKFKFGLCRWQTLKIKNAAVYCCPKRTFLWLGLSYYMTSVVLDKTEFLHSW